MRTPIVYGVLLALTACLLGDEAIDSETLQFIEQMAYLERIKTASPDCLRPDRKCPTAPVEKENRDPQLLVFISFSAPLETWKSYSQELEKLKGSFVLRGLPENSFRNLALKIKQMKEKGVNASILIDPEAFEMYRIDAVPTLVLKNGDRCDQVQGNISCAAALKLFAQSGDLKKEAQDLVIRLENKEGRGDG